MAAVLLAALLAEVITTLTAPDMDAQWRAFRRDYPRHP